MGKLISLQKYKDKKQSEELYHKLCREISAKIISLNKQSYYEPELYHDPVDDLLDRIGKLEHIFRQILQINPNQY
jgi:hypothetical protein